MPSSKQFFRGGVVLAALMLPLELVPNWVISILSLLTTLLLLQYAIARLSSGSRVGRLDLAVAACLWLPAVSAFLSVEVADHKSLAIKATVSLLHLALRAWLIFFLAEREELELFKRAVLWVGAIAVALGYFQYLGDLVGLPQSVTGLIPHYGSHGTYPFPRVHSLAHEPLYFANFLLLPIGLLVADVLTGARRPGWRNMLLIASLALFWTTLARGAAYGLVAALIIAALLSPRKSGLKQLAMPVVSSLVLSFLLVVAAGLATHHNTVTSFGKHAADVSDPSFTNRTATWHIARKDIHDHPILGVGPANSRPVFNNSYLTYAAEQGIVGVLLALPLVVLLAFLIVQSLRSPVPAYFAGYAIALISLAVQANTFEGFVLLRTWIVLGFALAAAKIDGYISQQITR